MIKKFILISIALIAAYLALIQWKLWFHARQGEKFWKNPAQQEQKETVQRVYSFSFSKYTDHGTKELEIEGDSADIFSQI